MLCFAGSNTGSAMGVDFQGECSASEMAVLNRGRILKRFPEMDCMTGQFLPPQMKIGYLILIHTVDICRQSFGENSEKRGAQHPFRRP